MKNIIKIQSIGDIITNSSTEVFTIIDSSTVTKMKDFIKVLLGEDALNRFEIKLDLESAFTELDYDNACETFTYKIEEIDDSIDFEEIINEKGADNVFNMLCHFYFPDYKYTQDAAEFDDNIKDVLKQIDIEEFIEDNNEGSDYPTYPGLIIRAVDPNNKKDVEIAKKLQNIPFFCETEARYC